MEGHFKHRLHPKKPFKALASASNPTSPDSARPGAPTAPSLVPAASTKHEAGSPATSSACGPSLSGTGPAAAPAAPNPDPAAAGASTGAPAFKGLKWKILHVYQDEQKAKEEREAEERKKKQVEEAARAAKQAELAAAEQARKEAEAEAARVAAEAEAARRQEAEAREAEAREREAKEREAREKEAREREAREREAREKEARESKEREAKEREAKEREAKEEAARAAKEKEEKERKARELEEARKRKAAAAAAAALLQSTDVDLMDDMFVTLPSMPSVAVKQEGRGEGKQDEGEPTKPNKKGMAKGVSQRALGASGEGEAGGKAHKADKVDKATKRVRDSEQDKAQDAAGEGGSVPKKAREGSEPGRLQAHNSLSGSTDKADGARPGTSAEGKLGAAAGDALKPSKKQRAEAGDDTSPPGRAQSKGSKQPGSGGKETPTDGTAGERRGSGAAAAPVVLVPVSPRLGPSIVVVKPGDNGSQDPAARKPAVVQLGGSPPLGVLSPAAAQSKNAPAAGGKKEGGTGGTGKAGGKDGEKGADKKAGQTAAAASAAKQATAAVGVTGQGKGKDKARAPAVPEARQGGAKQGDGGTSGAKQAGVGSTAPVSQATAGGGRTESGTQAPQERMVDCILECGRPGGAASTSGLPWDSQPPDLPRSNSALEAGAGSQPCLRVKVDLAKVRSVRELWAQLSLAFKSDVLPDRLRAQLIYMDGDGDWLLFAPDEPWNVIAGSARKLLISPTS